MGDPANFYLAASGVIPILALAYLIENAAVSDAPIRRSTLTRMVNFVGEKDLDSLLAGGQRGMVFSTVILGLFCGWAEVICLRTLETGRSPFGGSVVVWIAMALLFGLLLFDKAVDYAMTDTQRIAAAMRDYGAPGEPTESAPNGDSSS